MDTKFRVVRIRSKIVQTCPKQGGGMEYTDENIALVLKRLGRMKKDFGVTLSRSHDELFKRFEAFGKSNPEIKGAKLLGRGTLYEKVKNPKQVKGVISETAFKLITAYVQEFYSTLEIDFVEQNNIRKTSPLSLSR